MAVSSDRREDQRVVIAATPTPAAGHQTATDVPSADNSTARKPSTKITAPSVSAAPAPRSRLADARQTLSAIPPTGDGMITMAPLAPPRAIG
jgi:hypothetical protein